MLFDMRPVPLVAKMQEKLYEATSMFTQYLELLECRPVMREQVQAAWDVQATP